MSRSRLIIIAALVLAIIVVAWEHHRRSAAVQVPAVFARLAEAIQDRGAADVLATVHRDYQFSARWPQLFPDADKARGRAQQLLGMAFFHTRSEPITCEWTLHEWTQQPDGTVIALVSLTVAGGPFTQAVPPLVRHRFELTRSSPLTGFYRISGHDPFALQVPNLDGLP
jgi:hypothetical protein